MHSHQDITSVCKRVKPHLAAVFADGVLAAVVRPNELLRRSEALVSKRHGRVDDVFAIAADDDESSVGVVTDGLRVNLAGSDVLEIERQLLPIFHLRLRSERLDIGLGLRGKICKGPI